MFIQPVRLILWCAIYGVLAVPLEAAAWTNDESPRTIQTVGAHDGNNDFVTLVEGVYGTCAWGTLYFDVTIPLGKATLATLLVPKTSGQKVRVAYDAPSSTGTCFVKLASLVS